MAHLPLLVDLAAALLAAFVGGVLARTFKLPVMIGYLIGGIAIGPFTPGYVGHLDTFQQLAELGIIFLMFGIGLHFSLQDLWNVRRIAIPGAIFQMAGLTLLVIPLSPLFGWSYQAGTVIGLALSITSTVVMLRNLADQGLLNTPYGQIAVGWLILEDILTVLILVLLPAITTTSSEPLWQTAGLALLKAGLFAGGMLIVGTRIIPWALTRLALTQSRELFVIAIVALTIGTALFAADFFGVSLALGAFLAGMVVSESSLAHHVNSQVMPFKDLFTVLFFVSVGMLIDPLHLWRSAGTILVITAIIIVGKFVITAIISAILARSVRATLILAAGRSQIGEFSFVLGNMGMALGLLNREQYSLLLAGAMTSILINLFLFRALPWMEQRVQRIPALWSLIEGPQHIPEVQTNTLQDHVIVVGFGRVGRHIVRVLEYMGLPRLVVELDLHRVHALDRLGVPVLYGDAANSEILAHAQVKKARAVVITVPDEISASVIVATVRQKTKTVPIVVRAATQTGVKELLALEANDVIHPELEGGLNIVRQTLLYLGCDKIDIQQYTDAIRDAHYDLSDPTETPAEHLALDNLRATPGLPSLPENHETAPVSEGQAG